MRQLTEDDIRASFVNATDDELRLVTLPTDFLLTDWDHLDFLAWRDPRTQRSRLPHRRASASEPIGVVLRAAEGTSRARLGAVQRLPHDAAGRPGLAVLRAQGGRCRDCAATASARTSAPTSRATRTCASPHPLAPNEVRASVDARIDGTRQRAEAFVERVLESARADA